MPLCRHPHGPSYRAVFAAIGRSLHAEHACSSPGAPCALRACTFPASSLNRSSGTRRHCTQPRRRVPVWKMRWRYLVAKPSSSLSATEAHTADIRPGMLHVPVPLPRPDAVPIPPHPKLIAPVDRRGVSIPILALVSLRYRTPLPRLLALVERRRHSYSTAVTVRTHPACLPSPISPPTLDSRRFVPRDPQFIRPSTIARVADSEIRARVARCTYGQRAAAAMGYTTRRSHALLSSSHLSSPACPWRVRYRARYRGRCVQEGRGGVTRRCGTGRKGE
ncbi:hypothetical protein B0H17DRAFT_1337060 [Mycena rosella]|uniref:Uncharacterized protein n=1 Tax=Mycena rosella TaxID=1033263 RepID=A0AAD7CSR6_MYCRO|nr:hypothetical protein B0H17DRAFT_1337060 [Mycena rosella]